MVFIFCLRTKQESRRDRKTYRQDKDEGLAGMENVHFNCTLAFACCFRFFPLFFNHAIAEKIPSDDSLRGCQCGVSTKKTASVLYSRIVMGWEGWENF